MRLVEATEDDVDALAERWFALASGMERYSRFNELVYDDPESVPRDGFRRLLDDDRVTVYLLAAAGTTVGYLTLETGRHPSRTYSKYAKLVDLFVDEGHRNREYGSEAVERAKALALERGCDHLKVSCEWHNDGARRFYRENGFEEKQVTFVQELD